MAVVNNVKRVELAMKLGEVEGLLSRAKTSLSRRPDLPGRKTESGKSRGDFLNYWGTEGGKGSQGYRVRPSSGGHGAHV